MATSKDEHFLLLETKEVLGVMREYDPIVQYVRVWVQVPNVFGWLWESRAVGTTEKIRLAVRVRQPHDQGRGKTDSLSSLVSGG